MFVESLQQRDNFARWVLCCPMLGADPHEASAGIQKLDAAGRLAVIDSVAETALETLKQDLLSKFILAPVSSPDQLMNARALQRSLRSYEGCATPYDLQVADKEIAAQKVLWTQLLQNINQGSKDLKGNITKRVQDAAKELEKTKTRARLDAEQQAQAQATTMAQAAAAASQASAAAAHSKRRTDDKAYAIEKPANELPGPQAPTFKDAPTHPTLGSLKVAPLVMEAFFYR